MRSREPLIRYIRILGAALGGFVGLALATAGDGLFAATDYAGALLALWVVAWVVLGFALLPYITVVPATWLIRRVEELSTAEFVTAVVGLLIGLLMGLLLGLPLAGLPAPWGTLAAVRGVAVHGSRDARPDRRETRRPAHRRGGGRADPPAAGRRGRERRRRTAHRRRHERDHRRPDRGGRRVRVHLRDAGHPAVRPR